MQNSAFNRSNHRGASRPHQNVGQAYHQRVVNLVYSCPECSYTFTTSWDLRMHRYIHTWERDQLRRNLQALEDQYHAVTIFRSGLPNYPPIGTHLGLGYGSINGSVSGFAHNRPATPFLVPPMLGHGFMPHLGLERSQIVVSGHHDCYPYLPPVDNMVERPPICELNLFGKLEQKQVIGDSAQSVGSSEATIMVPEIRASSDDDDGDEVKSKSLDLKLKHH